MTLSVSYGLNQGFEIAVLVFEIDTLSDTILIDKTSCRVFSFKSPGPDCTYLHGSENVQHLSYPPLLWKVEKDKNISSFFEGYFIK